MRTLSAPSVPDWEDPARIHRDRLPPRAWFVPCPEAASTRAAMAGGVSPSVLPLDGTWRFHLAGAPAEVPEGFFTGGFDDSGWGTLPVPAHWQLHPARHPAMSRRRSRHVGGRRGSSRVGSPLTGGFGMSVDEGGWDNDRGVNWQTHTSQDARWRAAGLPLLQHRTDAVEVTDGEDDAAVVTVHTRVGPATHARSVTCEYRYTFTADGAVHVELHGVPHGFGWPENLPRIGLQMRVPAALERVDWFGPGPGESYRDSRRAARVGRWRAFVDGLWTPYPFPQENGNRHDVRRVALTDADGRGLRATGEPRLDFSVHRYTTEDIERARHPHELTPQPFLTVNLDLAQHGLGSTACGPDVLPVHRLACEPFRFAATLAPVAPDGCG